MHPFIIIHGSVLVCAHTILYQTSGWWLLSNFADARFLWTITQDGEIDLWYLWYRRSKKRVKRCHNHKLRKYNHLRLPSTGTNDFRIHSSRCKRSTTRRREWKPHHYSLYSKPGGWSVLMSGPEGMVCTDCRPTCGIFPVSVQVPPSALSQVSWTHNAEEKTGRNLWDVRCDVLLSPQECQE